MKILVIFAAGLLLSLSASSQILKPVEWSYASKKTSATEATVFIKATLNEGWHLYSQSLAAAGPVKTTFAFVPDKSFRLIGKVLEPRPVIKFEKVFNMEVRYFEKTVIFQQKVKLNGGKPYVKGSVQFMVCSDKQCLPPETIEFVIPVT